MKFFNELGFSDQYGQGFPSRWRYTEDRLVNINGTDKLVKCIKMVLAPVNFVGRLKELDEHINTFNKYLLFDGYKLVREGKEVVIIKADYEDEQHEKQPITEDEFVSKEFKGLSISQLGFDSIITSVLEQRLEEIKKCLIAKASLAVVFLCGSTLEGILLGVALTYPQEFNRASASPKKDGKVYQFHEWTLSNYIDVAHEIGLLEEDVKKFSHTLRDFRNYIHPYQQMNTKFNPHEHTALISWQVLQAAIYEIGRNKR